MIKFILHLLGFDTQNGLPTARVHTDSRIGGDLSAGTLYRLLRPARWIEA